ncbi:MAG TPA: pilus assembly protein PilM, partial [Lachnospiraceae bacterium]|nr:pilus assembly protein PilM [Lachnospiraceae bacterium]
MAKRVLSIDIGLMKTKICEMDYGKKNPQVYRCITFDTPSNVIEDGYIRDMENFAIAMKEKIAGAQIKVTDVVFTIASTKIANREVTVPLVKENRIQAVVDAGAQEYFPVDVSKYIISYSVLERISTKEERKLKLLLLAVPSNMVENYYEFAKMLDLHIVAMDYIGNSAFQIIKRQVGA